MVCRPQLIKLDVRISTASAFGREWIRRNSAKGHGLPRRLDVICAQSS